MTAKKKWKAPAGFTLTRHDGHYINERGFREDNPDAPRRPLMQDGAIEVLHFDDTEPFVETENDGLGPNASDAAKNAVRAGKPLKGWNPNVTSKPISNGWIPPTYILTKDSDVEN